MIRIEGHPREIILSRGNEYHDRVDISITVKRGTVTDDTIHQLMGYDKPRDYHRMIVVGTCLRGEEYPSDIPLIHYLLKEEV